MKINKKIKIACPIGEINCSARRPRWVRKYDIIKRSKGRCNSCLKIQKTRNLFSEPVELRLFGRMDMVKQLQIKVACPLKYLACTAKEPRWVFISIRHRSKGRCKSCSNFKGGGINSGGYRAFRLFRRLILEHRFIMEKILGRKLRKGETVHHINGKRADNREENLELRMSGNHPRGWSLRQMREYLETIPKRLGGLK